MPDPVPPLVDAAWIAGAGRDRDVVLVQIAGTPDGEGPESRLRGAAVVDWTRDLHEPVRRDVLGPDGFAALAAAHGIDASTHVVVAGAHTGYAASAYWLFRYHRHRRVSLLDGGASAVAGDVPPVAPASAGGTGAYRSPGPDQALRLSREELLSRFTGAAADGTVLLDGRGTREFAGRVEHPLDLPWEWHRVAGHVPGARNLPASELLTRDGRFRSRQELAASFGRRGIPPGAGGPEVAVYCRVGEAGALLWFALHELLGHRGVRVYDGGWAEYGSLVGVPVERGSG